MSRSPLGSMKDSIKTTTSFPDSETSEIGELQGSVSSPEADKSGTSCRCAYE